MSTITTLDAYFVLGILDLSEALWVKETFIPFMHQRAERGVIMTLITDFFFNPREWELGMGNELIGKQLLRASLDILRLLPADFNPNSDAHTGPKCDTPRSRYLSSFSNLLFTTAGADGMALEAEELARKSSDSIGKPYLDCDAGFRHHDSSSASGKECAKEAIHFIADLTDRLQAQQCQLPSAQIHVIRGLLVAILQRFLIPHIPDRFTKPSLWTHRPLRSCSRGPCNDCAQLNVFLALDEEVRKYRPGTANIHHLQTRLRRNYPAFQLSVNAWRTPNELTVRKCGPASAVRLSVLERKNTVREWAGVLKRLQSDELKLLLGEELYAEVILLETFLREGRHPLEALRAWRADNDQVTDVQGSIDASLGKTLGEELVEAVVLQELNGGAKRAAEDELGNAAKRQQVAEVVNLVSD